MRAPPKYLRVRVGVGVRVRVRVRVRAPPKYLRVGVRAQILTLGAATGGLAGGFEGAGATAQEAGKRPGPWLWRGWPWDAAAAEGGRRVNWLEGTSSCTG